MQPYRYKPAKITEIYLRSSLDVGYWTLALNCTLEDLEGALAQVGPSRARVQRFLKGRRVPVVVAPEVLEFWSQVRT